MRFAALGFALLSLAACQWDPPSQGARDSSVPPLTVEGYGDMRIGMTLAEARQASGQALSSETPDEPGGCVSEEFHTRDGDVLWLMFEENRLVRITAASEHAPHTRTAQNIGVGSTGAEVRTAYQNVVEQPAFYTGPPEYDLIAWTIPDQSGLRFEIDGAGHVAQMHAGGPAILYVEGCA